MDKRNCVKLGAAALAAMMSLSGIPSYAAVRSEKGFDCYKLVAVEKTLKDGCGHEGDAAHGDACYKSAYRVNRAYRKAMQKAGLELGFDLDGDGSVSDTEIITGINALNAETRAKFEAAVYEGIGEMEPDIITEDGSVLNKDDETLDNSCWLLVGKKKADGGEGPTFLLSTPKMKELAQGKTELPTLTQKILVTDDTGVTKRVDADDIAVGDTALFEAELIVPKGAADDGSKFILHAKTDGLKLSEGPKVFVDGTEAQIRTLDGMDASEDGCAVHMAFSLADGNLTLDGQPVTFEEERVITMQYFCVLDSAGLKAGANTSEAWAEYIPAAAKDDAGEDAGSEEDKDAEDTDKEDGSGEDGSDEGGSAGDGEDGSDEGEDAGDGDDEKITTQAEDGDDASGDGNDDGDDGVAGDIEDDTDGDASDGDNGAGDKTDTTPGDATDDTGGDAALAETVHDKNTVFTYGLDVSKTDEGGEALKGADFKLYRQDGDGWTEVALSADNADLELSEFAFLGLDAGTYKLVEDKAPAGHIKASDLVFEIRADFDRKTDDASLLGLEVYVDGELASEGEGAAFATDTESGMVSTSVVNAKGAHMPGTGASTRFLLFGSGSVLLLLGGGVYFGLKKRKGEA